MMMQNENTSLTPDLKQFIDKFEPVKFKLMKCGIEIRGINDMPANITHAKEIIEKMKLKLVVSHNAEMLSYRGFEVNNIV
ncbi:hypothetical protein [Pedobacter mendelii]|uniref:Uncharacterized protein n=1 Tax=Pedobacter mendelii TaxID=1908240 RepID=A0ABQ2BNY3_9SPHI|nr:hypothetical protein [Pedobacter mendelii]GGI29175.1 hypothetical protein GCM10008119_36330 [Pedobacter mendelii]